MYLGPKDNKPVTIGSSISSSTLLTDIPLNNDPRVQELYSISSIPPVLADVYFGVGCFWHVQHEFVQAEKNMLMRSDDQVTSYAGYAGGKANDTVCYHNFQGKSDYGKLGHGEVVGMKIPVAMYREFADEYVKLFDKNGDRPDKGDRGGEYRHMVGLPGGVKSPLFSQLEEAVKPLGVSLLEGKGSDPDNLSKKSIWVYDTEQFPFYKGEVYHQYHDGFAPGENYPESYNGLRKKALEAGRISTTGCPE